MLARLLLCLSALPLTALSVFADDPAALLPPDRPLPQVVDHYIDATLKTANVKAGAIGRRCRVSTAFDARPGGPASDRG